MKKIKICILTIIFSLVIFNVFADNEIYSINDNFILIGEQKINDFYTFKAFINKKTITNKIIDEHNNLKGLVDIIYIIYSNDNSQYALDRKSLKIIKYNNHLYYKTLTEKEYYNDNGEIKEIQKQQHNKQYIHVEHNTFFEKTINNALKLTPTLK